MAQIKYTVRENKKTGTHSFYAMPVLNGNLSFEELCREACRKTSIEPSIMRAAVSEFMETVQLNVLKGFRCSMGEKFITLYPNLHCSVKDKEGKPAKASMVNASQGRSRMGCTVSISFSDRFEQEVSWTKVDASGAPVVGGDIAESEKDKKKKEHGGGSDENVGPVAG